MTPSPSDTPTKRASHESERDALMQLLHPILMRVAELDVCDRTDPKECAAMAASLESEFPYASPQIRALGRAIARGVERGWLCDRGPENARFSRLAKPGPDTHDLSVDIVDMQGEAIEHTHPQGEVTICFPAGGPDKSDAELKFDGQAPGWVVLAPGSRHVPTVVGGRMQLMYFLPGGEVQWHT